MGRAFDEAWALLKAMVPFMPQAHEEQLGMGSYRATYGQQGVPHVTKFGTGENLADTMTLNRLAEMYPEMFVGEELHPMPQGQVPEWLTTRARGEDAGEELEYHDWDSRDNYVPGAFRLGVDAIQQPLAYTQARGNPIESTPVTEQYGPQRALLERLVAERPLLNALGMWDTKPENWSSDRTGIDIPEYGSGMQGKLIDPMFGSRRFPVYYTPEFNAASREFRRDMPEVREFAEPWYRGADQTENPELTLRILDELVRQGEVDLASRMKPLSP